MTELQAIVPPLPVLPEMQAIVEPIDELLVEFIFPTPGRNDSCWCGSGDKYKRCCLTVDQEAWRFVMLKTRQADAACAMLRMLPRADWPAFDPEEI